MSSNRPDREWKTEEDRAVLDADAGDFLEALAKSRRDHAASRDLEDVDRIRSAFESVVSDVLGEGKREPSIPAFPGFTVLEKAGQGAFGAVYKARDDKLGREVALKVLLPRFQEGSPSGLDLRAKERFLNEARALARIRHPNVLTIHAVLEEDGRVALVTEFIQGQPLSQILEERGPLSAAEAAQVGAEICRALAAVHASGLVHRDVKTPNILREHGGRIVLADFGLGVFLAEGKDAEKCGFVAGSPLFMAPEQLRGEELKPRVDLYSLGVVLYNLSTGKFPATARSLPELFAKIRTGALVSLRDARPDLPEAFTQVVTRALALDPEKRFQTAGEMEQALLFCCAPSVPTTAGTEGARSPGVQAAPRETPRPRKLFLPALPAVSAIAAVLLITLGLLFLLPSRTAFRVKAEPCREGRPLADGDRIAPGDGISLTLEADKPVHVYVLDTDDTGEVNPLFPRADIPIKNPLAPGKKHQIPGGEGWEVTSRGGEECILVLASLEPLLEVEEALRKDRLTPEVVLRGITRLKAARPGSPPAARGALAIIVDELKRAAKNAEEAESLWVRKISLRNP